MPAPPSHPLPADRPPMPGVGAAPHGVAGAATGARPSSVPPLPQPAGPVTATATATAIVLCAGRGERMRPLTDHTPKPLLAVDGRPLVAHHLRGLAAGGVRDVVLNTAWLEERFAPVLGDGSDFGLRLHWSAEGARFGGALETAGGIAAAAPLLAEAFWVVSGDVFLPGFVFAPERLAAFAAAARADPAGASLAHLWLVPNAPHHPGGDFGFDASGRVRPEAQPKRTWASVGLFQRAMFDGVAVGEKRALRPLLDAAMAAGRLSAEAWDGHWTDVGTPERLAALNAADAAWRRAAPAAQPA